MRLLLVGLIALSGCSTLEPVGKMSAAEVNWGEPIRAITTPDGKEGYVVSCVRGVDYCYERARKVCGGNYEVIDQNERTFLRPANEVSPLRTDVERTMNVACKS